MPLHWATPASKKTYADTGCSDQGFFVFCGLQGLLHLRENRRGAIAL
jgi:hypothetical protein